MGDKSEDEKKAAELNARIVLMMQQFEKNKTDKESLQRELQQ